MRAHFEKLKKFELFFFFPPFLCVEQVGFPEASARKKVDFYLFDKVLCTAGLMAIFLFLFPRYYPERSRCVNMSADVVGITP